MNYGGGRDSEVEEPSTCGAVDVEIVRVREGLCVFVPVLWVVPDVETQDRGNVTIETIDLAVRLRVIRRREGIPDAQNPASVLVQVAHKLWTIVGQHFLWCPVFEKSV